MGTTLKAFTEIEKYEADMRAKTKTGETKVVENIHFYDGSDWFC